MAFGVIQGVQKGSSISRSLLLKLWIGRVVGAEKRHQNEGQTGIIANGVTGESRGSV